MPTCRLKPLQEDSPFRVHGAVDGSGRKAVQSNLIGSEPKAAFRIKEGGRQLGMNQKTLFQIGNTHDAGLAQRAPDDGFQLELSGYCPGRQETVHHQQIHCPFHFEIDVLVSSQVNRSFNLKLGIRAPQAELIDGDQSGIIGKLQGTDVVQLVTRHRKVELWECHLHLELCGIQ